MLPYVRISKNLIWCVVLLALLPATLVFGQSRLNVVAWSGRLEPALVKPGARAKLLLTARVEPGWYIYGLTQPPGGPRATRLEVEENGVFTLDGQPQQPKPKIKFDPNFQIDVHTLSGEVTFTVPVKVAPEAAPGGQKLTAKATFQVCDDVRCLPPKTVPIEVEATIIAAVATGGEGKSNQLESVRKKTEAQAQPTSQASPTAASSPGARPATAIGASVDGSGRQPEASTTLSSPQNNSTSAAEAPSVLRWKSSGLLGYIWFAVGFGFLALLTPCVFPMIPITVSFFTKSKPQSHGAAVKQALVYCLGIILTFTGLGLALTLIMGPGGITKLAASPWMNLFLTVLFVVFALNLFGMFEIRLPSAWLSKLDAHSQKGTLVATLLMGLTFTLTSFTCTAAFVGTVLVAATRGEWFWATMGMLAFSTAFALPFFLLALFPQWLHSLPKSGGWLNSIKVVMGFLILAAAFKFLGNVDLVWEWNIVSRNLVLAAWIAIALVTAIYLLGKFQLPYDSPVERLGVLRMLASVFFLGIAFYLLSGLFGARLGELDAFLPPARTTAQETVTTRQLREEWLEDYEKAIEQARLANKPVFINFTGITCTNCRWMENNMFTDPQVKKELEQFALAKLFTDRQRPEDERNRKLQEENFGTVALPLYVIVGSDGKELAKFEGLTRDRAQFISFLQAGLSRFNQLAVLR
jgi:thiol:disulfide interchange protein DsbD